MKKKSFLLLLILCILITCFAVFYYFMNNTRQKINTANSLSDSGNAADSFLNEPETENLGAFSFGIISSSDDDIEVYEYNGGELHVPFRVEGMDEKARSDFGLMVFVDGLSQSYKIMYKDGRTTDEQYMHKFYLYDKERQEFDIVFTPVASKNGERLSVVFATIFNPDFMPDDERNANYGIFHSISANAPQEIYFKAEPENSKKLTSYSEYTLCDIPQEKIDKFGAEDIDDNFITEITKRLIQ